MTPLSVIPDGIEQIRTYLGNPDADGDMVLDMKWAAANLVVRPLPWPMRLSWNEETIQRIQAHRMVIDSLLDALDAVGKEVGVGELRARDWDRWGGCFNFRYCRQAPVLSVHSWGAAVDICPALGRQGVESDALSFPSFYVKAFKERGWKWGGDWHSPWLNDAMHFQACSGY